MEVSGYLQAPAVCYPIESYSGTFWIWSVLNDSDHGKMLHISLPEMEPGSCAS